MSTDTDISQADVNRLVRIKRLLNELATEYVALAGEITDEFSAIYELDSTACCGSRALGWEDLISIMQKDIGEALES